MATNRTITACIVMAMVIAVGNALQCHQCGQYNDGVGSITPCLNYTDQSAHLYLKDCPRSSDKFCIKYVSELSVVRDCVGTCVEKEVWNTFTYCCNENGCNHAYSISKPTAVVPAIMAIIYTVINLLNNH